MKKVLVFLVAVAVIVGMLIVTVDYVQAGQAGRDNSRFAYQLGCGYRDVIECAGKWVERLGGFNGGVYDRNYNYGSSAGESAAFLRGQSDALAELQRNRENEAYNLGRGSVFTNSGSGFSNFNGPFTNSGSGFSNFNGPFTNSGSGFNSIFNGPSSCYGDCGPSHRH